MTANRRLKDNSFKGWLIFTLFLFLSLKSCVVKGASMTFHNLEYFYEADRYLLNDSAGEKTGKPFYLGCELALAEPVYTLKSDHTRLNHRRVSNLGVTAGGVAANKFGKIKINAGLYYSDASLPYSFGLFTRGLSANVYLLRIGNAKCHTVEPYFIGGISRQHIKFYGNYLNENGTRNHSTLENSFWEEEILRNSILAWVLSIG